MVYTNYNKTANELLIQYMGNKYGAKKRPLKNKRIIKQ